MPSCPKNTYGQPICQIVDHPDRHGESFCATCQRRFVQSREGTPSQSTSQNDGFGFLSIVGGVCVALLIVSVATEQPQPEPDTPQPQAAQTSSMVR